MRTPGAYSLRWALPAGLLALMLAVISLSFVNAYWHQQAALAAEARQSLLTEAHRLARLAEDEGILGRGRVATELALAGADARVRYALLLDHAGRILVAQRKEWIGRMAADVVPGLNPARLERALGNSLPDYQAGSGGASMDVFLSHARPADRGELRGHGRGVVYLAYDLRAARAEVLRMVFWTRIPELLGMVFLTVLLYGLLSRHVVGPLARLEAASQRLSQGADQVRVAETGPAELAGLAHAFNAMAEAVTRARKALEASEERLAITLQSIGDAIISTDLHGRVALMNPVAESLTGWRQAEAVGQPVERVFQIENALTGAPAEIPVERVIRDGLVVGLANHTVLVSRNGARYHIADSAAPIRDRAGTLLGVVMVFRDVTESYALRRALEDSEQHFRTLANSGQALIWTSGPDKGCDYFNEIWLRFTGRTLEQERGNGWIEGVHPEDLQRCMDTYVTAFDRREPFNMTYRLRRHDGQYRWILDEGTPRFDSQGRFIGYVGHCLDVTERMALEAEAVRGRAELQALFNALPDLFFLLSADGMTILDYRARDGEELFLPPAHFLGKRLADLMPEEVVDRHRSALAELRRTGLPTSYEYALPMAGVTRWYEARLNTLGPDGEVIALVRDITPRKESEETVHRLAFFDALTGLPNRRLFMDRLVQALAAARRTHQMGAVLFVDLDQFKQVNDARGHAVGDQLLRQVAERLTHYLREEDSVARLGGDEFVILLVNLATHQDDAARLARSVADKVRAALESPFEIDGQAYSSGASIGITVFPKGMETVDDLLREADTAMYRAKEAGRNAVRYFEPAMQEAVAHRYALERDLREAVAAGALEMYLQTQVDQAGQIVGAEALLRWSHPERGQVPPASFIPVAEDSGLIVPLGEWVLREACRVIARLETADLPMRIAVNVSPRQFRQPDFVQRVRAILAETGADPTRLILEVTEGLLMEHAHDPVAPMLELAGMGLRFSIDDFGTGYSSLSYLKRLPIHEIKIDRSFVRDVPDDPNDAALVRTILSVAENLHLHVVAEGVENMHQARFLIDHGCGQLQGYLYGSPMPAENWIAGLMASRSGRT